MTDEPKINLDRMVPGGTGRNVETGPGSKGTGRGWHGDPERHAQAGRKGGRVSGGNFANNRERASEAGRKGGQASALARSQNNNEGAQAGTTRSNASNEGTS